MTSCKTMSRAIVLLAALACHLAAASPYQKAVALPRPQAEDVDYRLPTDLVPESYIVCLVPYLDGEGERSFTFDGTVNIRIVVKRTTDVITLHSDGLWIHEDSTEVVEPATNAKTAVTRYDVDLLRHFLHIRLEKALVQDKTYELHMKFNGTLNEAMNGFYRSSYAQGGETRWMATTQFQPTHARKAFPCFDEPNMKATFHLNIARKQVVQHVLSNMPIKETSPPDFHIGGRVWDSFEESPKMSTYLVAFMVSDFWNLRSNTFSVWARQDAVYQAAYAVQVGPQVLRKLEEFTGINYTLPKMDNVAIADFSAGAMENWGLITYRETSLLYDPVESTESNRQRVATVVAHEIAHMWYGDLVTMDWWGFTWLNEGFARYLQYVSTDLVETDWQLLDQFVVDQLQVIFRSDALLNSPPLSNLACASPADISAMFGSTSYSKGGSVLRMLDHILTRKTFQEGLHNYLSNNTYSNTVPDQLFSELDAVATQDGALPTGVTVKTIMDTWTLKPGYPYVTVSRSTKDPQVFTITQKRFLLQPDETNPDASLWYVPLTWTRGSDDVATAFQDTKPKAWMKGEASIDLPNDIRTDEWVIFNNQLTGYYRVAYDDELWKLLLAALKAEDFADRIHVVNRAQIVDDALNLARGGVITYREALEATRFLREEVSYVPWVAAFNGFSYLDSRLITSIGFEAFRRYVVMSMEKLYSNVTFNENAADKQPTILNRVNALTWACKYGLKDCVDNAKWEFAVWMDEGRKISANKKTVVYCTALKQGGQSEWNFLWQEYSRTTIATEEVLILSALGCTNDQELLNNYLMKSITDDSGIRKQDAQSVLSAVYNNPDGVDTAFNFFVSNFPRIQTYYVGSNAISNAITGIAAKLTTPQQVDRLRTFIADNADIMDDNVRAAGAKAIEAAEADLEWTLKHAETILDWIVSEVGTSGAWHSHAASGVVAMFGAIALFFARLH